MNKSNETNTQIGRGWLPGWRSLKRDKKLTWESNIGAFDHARVNDEGRNCHQMNIISWPFCSELLV